MLLKKNLINDWIDFLDNGDMAAYIIKEVKSIETGKDYLELTCRAERLLENAGTITTILRFRSLLLQVIQKKSR